MFLDQEIRRIQKAKKCHTICCDLRRQLVHIEVLGIKRSVFNPVTNLSLGLAVIERVLEILRERKSKGSP